MIEKLLKASRLVIWRKIIREANRPPLVPCGRRLYENIYGALDDGTRDDCPRWAGGGRERGDG